MQRRTVQIKQNVMETPPNKGKKKFKKSLHNFPPHCQPKRGKFGSALGKGGKLKECVQLFAHL